MNRAPTVVAVCASYLTCLGLAFFGWFAFHGQAHPLYALLSATPLALQLLWSTRTRPARARVTNSIVCFMFLPLLLGMAGAVLYESGPLPTLQTLSETTLKAEGLFEGAANTQVLSTGANEIVTATFSDGSMMRLNTLSSPKAAQTFLATLSTAMKAKAISLGTRAGMGLQVPHGMAMYTERHGAALLDVYASSFPAVAARLSQQRVPPPPAESLASMTAPKPMRGDGFGMVLVAYFTIHMLCFLLLALWASVVTTRVAKSPHTPPVSAGLLLARIDSLPAAGAPCLVTPGASSQERIVRLTTDDALRSHHLILRSDPQHGLVHVLEREGAHGAAPRTAEEARMGSRSSHGFGVGGPKVQKIWKRSTQTTLIDPERLARVPLTFEGPVVRVPEAFASALDPEGMIELVCALVTRSGFDYQPMLFAFQARWSLAKP